MFTSVLCLHLCLIYYIFFGVHNWTEFVRKELIMRIFIHPTGSSEKNPKVHGLYDVHKSRFI